MAIRTCRYPPGGPGCQARFGVPRVQFWILSLTLGPVGTITPYPPCSRTPFRDLSLRGGSREAWKDERSNQIKPEVSETRVM